MSTRGTKRRRTERKSIVPKVRGLSLGRRIASRRLESAFEQGRVVSVELGKPVKARGADDYYCPYRIIGIGDGVVRAAYGVDAIQALQLAMHAIGSTLAAHRDLRFFGNEDLGFPSPEDLHILAEEKKRRASSTRQRD